MRSPIILKEGYLKDKSNHLSSREEGDENALLTETSHALSSRTFMADGGLGDHISNLT